VESITENGVVHHEPAMARWSDATAVIRSSRIHNAPYPAAFNSL
jgi:hypothetical protein